MKDEHSQKPLAFGKRDSERILARNRFLLLCFTTHPGAFFEVVSSYCLCGGSPFAPARSSCNPPVSILYLQKKALSIDHKRRNIFVDWFSPLDPGF